MDQKNQKQGAFGQALQQFSGKAIDPKVQQDLNKPWSDPKTALSEEEKAFLEALVKKIESGEINLMKPSSILNEEHYETLESGKKAEADLWINATLALIRQIYDFYKNPHDNNSDMMISMIRELRGKKEMLEKELGDVLKI